MYKYSQKAQQRYFSVPELCYLFAVFALSKKAQGQTRKKIEKKGEEYSNRILKEIEDIKTEAIFSLQFMQ